MDILVDKYMREIEQNEQSNYDKLAELETITLDVFFESNSYIIDICGADIDPDKLTIKPYDIQEMNIEICGTWCKLDHKFLYTIREATVEFYEAINKSLETYLNKKGIY